MREACIEIERGEIARDQAPAAALLALGRGGGGGGGGGVEADGGTREVCVIEVERSERCVSVSGACCRVYAVSGACCQAAGAAGVVWYVKEEREV